MCAQEFDSYSSKKIKVELGRTPREPKLKSARPTTTGESDDKFVVTDIYSDVLSLIGGIDFIKYTHIDPISDGDGSFYGVVAEELEQVKPEWVDRSMRFLPNIMKEASCTEVTDPLFVSCYKLTFDRSGLMIDDDDGFSVGGMVKIISSDNHTHDGTIKLISSSYIYVAWRKDESDTDSFTPDQTKNVILYGTYGVCKTVTKARLFEAGFVATKYLLKKVEQLEKEIKSIKSGG